MRTESILFTTTSRHIVRFPTEFRGWQLEQRVCWIQKTKKGDVPTTHVSLAAPGVEKGSVSILGVFPTDGNCLSTPIKPHPPKASPSPLQLQK